VINYSATLGRAGTIAASLVNTATIIVFSMMCVAENGEKVVKKQPKW
jgi:hypothetical protein